MFQLLLAPILAALGIGGGTAAGLGTAGAAAGSALTAPALMGGTGGLASGLAGLAGAAPAVGPTVGAAAGMAAPTGMGAALSKFAPNLMGMGKNLMGGNFQGAGGNLANMMGSPNLANMITNPSWENAGKSLKEELNPATPLSPVGSGRNQVSPISIPQTSNRIEKTDDPILNKMYQAFNPQQQGLTKSGMKPWGQSPYPRRMSPV